ncbi:MAG TPA: J domain-containing protein [Acidimicrobiales bacterium]|nr:J domain-containing protein [Acidimicrobiales bacterium]
MLVAELEVRHSRPFSPTRRVALGELWLPTDPAPGMGGVLLAGVVAAGVSALEGEEDILDRVDVLLDDLEANRRVVQPRVLHRFQLDVHGLDRSRHRLLADGERLRLDLDDHGAVLPQLLGAMYAAAMLSYAVRGQVFRLLRRATRWTGGIDDRLLQFLTGDEASTLRRRGAFQHDERWAMTVLGFSHRDEPSRRDIQQRFRDLVREAHPDHGAESAGAGERMVELSEARRILLESS